MFLFVCLFVCFLTRKVEIVFFINGNTVYYFVHCRKEPVSKENRNRRYASALPSTFYIKHYLQTMTYRVYTDTYVEYTCGCFVGRSIRCSTVGRTTNDTRWHFNTHTTQLQIYNHSIYTMTL